LTVLIGLILLGLIILLIWALVPKKEKETKKEVKDLVQLASGTKQLYAAELELSSGNKKIYLLTYDESVGNIEENTEVFRYSKDWNLDDATVYFDGTYMYLGYDSEGDIILQDTDPGRNPQFVKGPSSYTLELGGTALIFDIFRESLNDFYFPRGNDSEPTEFEVTTGDGGGGGGGGETGPADGLYSLRTSNNADNLAIGIADAPTYIGANSSVLSSPMIATKDVNEIQIYLGTLQKISGKWNIETNAANEIEIEIIINGTSYYLDSEQNNDGGYNVKLVPASADDAVPSILIPVQGKTDVYNVAIVKNGTPYIISLIANIQSTAQLTFVIPDAQTVLMEFSLGANDAPLPIPAGLVDGFYSLLDGATPTYIINFPVGDRMLATTNITDSVNLFGSPEDVEEVSGEWKIVTDNGIDIEIQIIIDGIDYYLNQRPDADFIEILETTDANAVPSILIPIGYGIDTYFVGVVKNDQTYLISSGSEINDFKLFDFQLAPISPIAFRLGPNNAPPPAPPTAGPVDGNYSLQLFDSNGQTNIYLYASDQQALSIDDVDSNSFIANLSSMPLSLDNVWTVTNDLTDNKIDLKTIDNRTIQSSASNALPARMATSDRNYLQSVSGTDRYTIENESGEKLVQIFGPNYFIFSSSGNAAEFLLQPEGTAPQWTNRPSTFELLDQLTQTYVSAVQFSGFNNLGLNGATRYNLIMFSKTPATTLENLYGLVDANSKEERKWGIIEGNDTLTITLINDSGETETGIVLGDTSTDFYNDVQQVISNFNSFDDTSDIPFKLEGVGNGLYYILRTNDNSTEYLRNNNTWSGTGAQLLVTTNQGDATKFSLQLPE